ITAKLREMGMVVQEGDDSIRLEKTRRLKRANVKTMPYPGFPTDMQPQMGVILTQAHGTSVITEGVWDSRYKYVNELKKMGAQIQVDGKTAVIEGHCALSGAPVAACDLRAGAAMVIAGLCASGVTWVEDIHFIERGYEDFVGKLRSLGGDITLVSLPDEPDREDTIAG
ncbi:MAG: UDP-N-acetylglucosamine 1-carboxyvinyltransferase, partial [Oscillospiraceae bacterium]|nr:UDP-N-acetylglucosamine 1-carboxyvinyltransferase [Oscillospiraceae bacterium]